MSSRKHCSPSSEDENRYALIDEKKQKRMISNRESARRSRMRRQQHIKDLKRKIMYFISIRNEMVQKINEITQHYTTVESENIILRVQKEELRKRLESVEMVTNYMYMANEHSVYSLQDSCLNPWQPPLQFQPIMTSAGIFQF
ncbi:basic region/leucine zipper motif 53 [Abeliophyllum distichum]|uniref:Basic region/leucine zipper motif 53 n=1 Tax=Abeliophyllum distichum TaxID=126358 RepID=A0ABD1PMX1_9LAMI